MTIEQRLKILIGELHFQIAGLSVALDEANAKIAALTPKAEPARPETTAG